MTTLTPLALPDTSWAARLVDAVDIMDGSRDAYSITLQVTPDLDGEPQATIRIWAKNHHDAHDAVTAFKATPDNTATSNHTQVWARHYTDGPMVEIITARPAGPAGLAGAA